MVTICYGETSATDAFHFLFLFSLLQVFHLFSHISNGKYLKRNIRKLQMGFRRMKASERSARQTSFWLLGYIIRTYRWQRGHPNEN